MNQGEKQYREEADEKTYMAVVEDLGISPLEQQGHFDRVNAIINKYKSKLVKAD